ncbi:uncharacterized protein LOC136029026 isoform X2 [Artemia franciscana]|uniref:uncharacterized protein LOC136029026 isoform X2 n=1 Tax=Artemia franciscana TaxID=6661 RepID=UPI0032DACB3B
MIVTMNFTMWRMHAAYILFFYVGYVTAAQGRQLSIWNLLSKITQPQTESNDIYDYSDQEVTNSQLSSRAGISKDNVHAYQPDYERTNEYADGSGYSNYDTAGHGYDNSYLKIKNNRKTVKDDFSSPSSAYAMKSAHEKPFRPSPILLSGSKLFHFDARSPKLNKVKENSHPSPVVVESPYNSHERPSFYFQPPKTDKMGPPVSFSVVPNRNFTTRESPGNGKEILHALNSFDSQSHKSNRLDYAPIDTYGTYGSNYGSSYGSLGSTNGYYSGYPSSYGGYGSNRPYSSYRPYSRYSRGGGGYGYPSHGYGYNSYPDYGYYDDDFAYTDAIEYFMTPFKLLWKVSTKPWKDAWGYLFPEFESWKHHKFGHKKHQYYAGRKRRNADTSEATGSPLLNLIYESGLESIVDPECQKKYFCDVFSTSSKPEANDLYKSLWYFANLFPEAVSDYLGIDSLQTLLKNAQNGMCSLYNCKKKQWKKSKPNNS